MNSDIDKSTKYYLTNEQTEALVKLMNEEKDLNKANGDDVYNKFWDDIIHSLGYATHD